MIVCPQLPHTKVMPLVDAVISSGGWGTTTKALAAGVPVVVIPHGLDTANTARVVAAAACGVSVDSAEPEAITAALVTVLHDRYIADNAHALADVNAPADAVHRAISVIHAARV